MASGSPHTARSVGAHLHQYPLLDALRHRRSRRFGRGMAIPRGPFAYASRHAPLPLSEEEEAALAFAACGITGAALADLAYGPGQGGSMVAGLVSRTVASPDAINAVAVVLINDQATYLLKRPQDFPPGEIPTLIGLADQGALTELYHRSRVRLADRRVAPPVTPDLNFNINRWSLYAPGSTYLLPINELTAIYLNALLEAFEPEMGLFILDERARFQPAGLAAFGKRKGGQLADDLTQGRVGTVQAIEFSLLEGVAIEQGMVLQNLALMAQALGVGGFPNFARHDYSWFQALNFRMGTLPASRYFGAGRLTRLALRLLRRDAPVPYPLGLERAGAILLRPYCPPYYPSMTAAVHAFVDSKFGAQGVFRGGAAVSAWRDPATATAQIAPPSAAAIAATSAYAEYIHGRYGRFPAYSPPFRTILGYQATHVDAEFYERFYRPEALSPTQRRHLEQWHAGDAATGMAGLAGR